MAAPTTTSFLGFQAKPHSSHTHTLLASPLSDAHECTHSCTQIFVVENLWRWGVLEPVPKSSGFRVSVGLLEYLQAWETQIK